MPYKNASFMLMCKNEGILVEKDFLRIGIRNYQKISLNATVK